LPQGLSDGVSSAECGGASRSQYSGRDARFRRYARAGTYPLRVRLGGTFNPGRHLAVGSQPIANLWVTMLNSVGINATSFGNSTGALSLT
jgi:hypothetical protein